MRNLLVEKGHVTRNSINCPKDVVGRHFSSDYYVRKLPNRETCNRKWLIYSKELDMVFCFRCKLFKTSCSRSNLANEGTRDLKHLGDMLKHHENSSEHLSNLRSWAELKVRLEKKSNN